MRHSRSVLAAVVMFLTYFSCLSAAEREYGGFFPAEKLQQARANVARSDWAARIRDEAVKRAASWSQRTDEELWLMVPGQDLPRCIDVTLTRGPTGTIRVGCLQCGKDVDRLGGHPDPPNFEVKPWKLKCPSCGAVFPTNDFGAYYRSGIDDRGLFNPARADRRLLFNTAHPDPADPLHNFGVDDGFGYVAHDGHEHRFIGYYTWKYWRWLLDGLQALADAYVYTGDQTYAHKAAVLLDRIADVYPDMDWKPYAARGWYHSDGGRRVGKIEGAIWENETVRKIAEAYDAILSGTSNDRELGQFLGGQAQRYRLPSSKGTRDQFVRNVDERFLRCVYRAVLSEQIIGNEGMHQMTVTSAALALNSLPETARWLDWLFAPKGGAIPGLLVSRLDRDGGSTEGAPGYALVAGALFNRIAARLHDYPLYPGHDLLREFPQLRASFTLGARLAALGVAVPNIGDAGGTGLISTAPGDRAFSATGFRYTGDSDMAFAAYRLNHNSAAGLGRDIFAADPDGVAAGIERVVSQSGLPPRSGELLNGFGLALLETGDAANGMALACNYGRTSSHAHADTLNFDILGFGHWLAPDFGYPEYATDWPGRTEWTGNTLAHNTVFVDGHPQRRSWGGKAQLFCQLPGYGVFEIDGRAAYPKLDAYARTMVLIAAPDGKGAYAVDVFRVRGGSDHIYSFHGPPGEITTQGLEVESQNGGTYAGEKIPYGAAAGFPVGYSYLYDVRRSTREPAAFMADWRVAAGYRGTVVTDNLHLRLHALNGSDDVALAKGDPPQKAGNPRTLEYILQHRAGTALESTFVSVMEPYRERPFIRSVQRLATGRDTQVVLRIELVTGEVDLVFSNPVTESGCNVDGTQFNGRMGFVRVLNGETVRAVLVDGTRLERGEVKIASPGEFTGKVVRMNRALEGGGWIWVDTALPLNGSLVGQSIHVANDIERDATYMIRSVERDGELTKIYCGAISFVRGYNSPTILLRGQVMPSDYTKGFLYDFEPGASFRIPLHLDWQTGKH